MYVVMSGDIKCVSGWKVQSATCTQPRAISQRVYVIIRGPRNLKYSGSVKVEQAEDVVLPV